MSRRIFKVGGATVLMAALAAVAGPAESAEMGVRVPFGFVVGGKELPAGHYRIQVENGVLLVRGTRDGALVLTLAAASRDEKAKLVFYKYGDQLVVLREVHSGAGSGRVLPESARERALKEQVRRAAMPFEVVAVPAL